MQNLFNKHTRHNYHSRAQIAQIILGAQTAQKVRVAQLHFYNNRSTNAHLIHAAQALFESFKHKNSQCTKIKIRERCTQCTGRK